MARGSFQLSISKAQAVSASTRLKLRKSDTTSADLTAGGLKVPQQGKTSWKLRQKAAPILKELFRKLPVEVQAIPLNAEAQIETLEGTMSGQPGDWLVTGVKGEQYIVRADIFAETFEPADADAKRLLNERSTFVQEEEAPVSPEQKADVPAPAPPPPANTGRVFAGIPVNVDRPKGFVQEGQAQDGTRWRRVYHVDYGHIPGTLGGDGDGIDVFIGGDEATKEAHWILQRKEDGSFDEYKVMLGFLDRETAKMTYFAHVPKKFFGSICSMSIEMMKALLGIEPCDSIAKAEDLVRSIIESGDGLGVLGTKKPVAKPFAGFETFEACLIAQREAGHGDEEAQKICGSLQAEAEKDARPEEVSALLAHKNRSIKVAKAEEQGEQRYVLGIVLEPETTDLQGDIYSADEIRRSAWTYMRDFRNIGYDHKGLVNGKVILVESWIEKEDRTIAGSQVRAGSWLIGIHVVDDELWSKIKTGELTAFSIGGFARRSTVA